MTPELWQRAEGLARAALARPPAERLVFLAEGSAGDEELRSKAESLLSFYARSESEDSGGRQHGEATGGLLSTVRIETLAGRALAYVDYRNQNVWARPVDGGPPRQLTDFKTDQTFYFDWSRDGRQMALARGTQTNDVVTITDFK